MYAEESPEFEVRQGLMITSMQENGEQGVAPPEAEPEAPASSSETMEVPVEVHFSADTIDNEGRSLHRRRTQSFNLKNPTSQQDIIAQLPSHRLDYTLSLDRKHTHSLRRRKSNKSFKTLRPPQEGLSGDHGDLGVDMVDREEEEEFVEDEEEHWYRMQNIKSLTSSLDFKRQTRSELKAATPVKLTGIAKWKHERAKGWQKTQKRWREILGQMEVWQGSFKTIEGHFGSSVVAYFRFLKWLLYLNLLIAIIILCVMVFPQQFIAPSNINETFTAAEARARNNTELVGFIVKSWNCTTNYDLYNKKLLESRNVGGHIVDFIQGTGFMEQTVLFTGYYFDKLLPTSHRYNMPVAFVLGTFSYFLLSLIFLVNYTGKSVRSGSGLRDLQFYKTCNSVFCGWDYNLTKKKAAGFKHNNLMREYQKDIAEQRRKDKLASMTRGQKFVLYMIRFAVNIIVLAIWGASGYVIYLANDASITLLESSDNKNEFLTLLYQFIPSLTITGLNLVIPLLFEKIIILEDYAPDTEMKITIGRTVFLRLASITVLVFSLETILRRGTDEDCTTSKNIYCWETYVGQQFYKLVLVNFGVMFITTFFVQFPRTFIVRHFDNNKLLKLVGEPEFEIPRNVLDLVYTQTLCWLGAFYCPLIPSITVLILFVCFYLKKLTVLHTCIPSPRPYEASRSAFYFMSILLLSFVLCVIPILYSITRVTPSPSCGPFRIFTKHDFYIITAIGNAVNGLPNIVGNILIYLTSWTFYVPMAIILGLIIYYYTAVASGHTKMIDILKEHLAMEGKDKQFLLSQVRQALSEGRFKAN